MKIRKTKKLLKIRKQAVEISVKDWDIEDGNSIDLTKAKVLTLHRDGSDDITRIEA